MFHSLFHLILDDKGAPICLGSLESYKTWAGLVDIEMGRDSLVI